jgi:Fe-S cluster assembly protein SufD
MSQPDWVKSLRLNGLTAFNGYSSKIAKRSDKLDFDLSKLKVVDFKTTKPLKPLEMIAKSDTILTLSDRRCGTLVQFDGMTISTNLAVDAEKKGVIFMDLSSAIKKYPELVKKYLFSAGIQGGAERFLALNAALWQGGVFLYIPRNVRIDLPFQIFNIFDETIPVAAPHTLIVSEEGGVATIIETVTSIKGTESIFVNHAVEVHALAGSNVTYFGIQELSNNALHKAVKKTYTHKDAQVSLLEFGKGAFHSHSDIEMIMNGPGGIGQMLGLYLAQDSQTLEYETLQHHVAPHCTSDLLYKGALKGSSSATFDGLIRVDKKAQKTNAYQANKNLLLSGTSRVSSTPRLEIEANDVRCTHGATVGPLDREDLFYLMSRGLSKDEAVKLLTMGFFSQVLDRIVIEDLRTELARFLESKIFE